MVRLLFHPKEGYNRIDDSVLESTVLTRLQALSKPKAPV